MGNKNEVPIVYQFATLLAINLEEGKKKDVERNNESIAHIPY